MSNASVVSADIVLISATHLKKSGIKNWQCTVAHQVRDGQREVVMLSGLSGKPPMIFSSKPYETVELAEAAKKLAVDSRLLQGYSIKSAQV